MERKKMAKIHYHYVPYISIVKRTVKLGLSWMDVKAKP